MLKPQEVDPVTFAFPANVIGTLLPKEDEIPKEFWRSNPWSDAAETLFFKGGEGWVFTPHSGVDQNRALRQILACLRSYQPKHEHKIAGVGYLLGQFFEAILIPPTQLVKHEGATVEAVPTNKEPHARAREEENLRRPATKAIR